MSEGSEQHKAGRREAGEVQRRLRGLLDTGLVGRVVVAIGNVWVHWRPTRLRPLPARGLLVLTSAQHATATAVAECVCPAGQGFPGAAEVGVASKLDAILARSDETLQWQLALALSLIESGLAAGLMGEGLAPFSRLDADARARRMRAWRDSRVGARRAVAVALRNACAVIYFGDPRTWGSTGYAGPPSPAALRRTHGENLIDFATLRASGPRR